MGRRNANSPTTPSLFRWASFFKILYLLKLRYYITFIITFFLTNIYLFGQVKSSTFKQAILNSDSVLLVSHNMTEQRVIEDKVDGKIKKTEPIVLRQRPNKKIIHETVLLNDSLKRLLIKILTQPYEGKIETAKCFMPHHSILLLKNGKTEYVEICFACQNLLTSKNIGTKDINYSPNMWTQLETFFLELGIKYQIPFDPDKE